MKSIKEQLGLRIQEIRKNRGLNQADLSEMIGVDAKHISRLETGTTFPSPATLEELAKALNVSVMTLFNFEHLADEEESKRKIDALLNGAGEDKLQLIYKVVKAILQ